MILQMPSAHLSQLHIQAPVQWHTRATKLAMPSTMTVMDERHVARVPATCSTPFRARVANGASLCTHAA